MLSVDRMTNNTFQMPKLTKQGIEGREFSYAAGTLIPEHAHRVHQIVYAVSGVMHVTMDDSVWLLPSSKALWVPADRLHSICCSGRVDMRTIYINEYPYPAAPRSHVFDVSPLLREILVRLAQGCREEQTSLLADLLLDEIASLDAEEHLRMPVPRDARIATMLGNLQHHPDDQTTLQEWADQLGFSQRNLIRTIRSETGMSFRELRRQIRIHAAIALLAQGQSVTRVAFDVGFSTPSAFVHAFGLVTGTTPGKYGVQRPN